MVTNGGSGGISDPPGCVVSESVPWDSWRPEGSRVGTTLKFSRGKCYNVIIRVRSNGLEDMSKLTYTSECRGYPFGPVG